ncbi:MAG: glycoside hydrolase family 3 C-terminal domain-containing protein [Flavobacteriales bacterium]|nr:glycoside hydrolase family 3 C-terminal domain-containing protein [Flavobacteriales bacterium]
MGPSARAVPQHRCTFRIAPPAVLPTRLSLLCCALLCASVASAQLPYKDPSLPIPARVSDLLARMTPDEKFRQLFMVAGELGPDSTRFTNGLFGFQVNATQQQGGAADQLLTYAAGPDAQRTLEKVNGMQRFFIERTRLGIPMIAFDEALHGLVRNGATAFPQSICMAASFDTTLMGRVSAAIANETEARGLRMVLSPVVNLATDVRWGRVEETYGEDPYLASLFGVSYVQAMESRGILTTPKHFVANHGAGGRDSYPAFWSERHLRETYFKPFQACIQQGGARSIMTAYNSLDGRPCSANGHLLNDVLRRDWGFRGFVISDAAATGGANVLHVTARDYEDAGRQSVENGQDVIFQTDFAHYELFKKPFLDGTVKQAAIDSAVAHVLAMKFELGLFDQPYMSDSLLKSLDLNAHRELAYEMAVKGAVLLKNENNVLPLSSTDYRITVLGSDAMDARLGGYSGPGNAPISIFAGIEAQLGKKPGELTWAVGCTRVDEHTRPVEPEVLRHGKGKDMAPGLIATYFNGIDLSAAPAFTRTDEQIDFQWTLFGPDPRVDYDHFAVRWEGMIAPIESGTFNIGVEGMDGYRLWLNNTLVIDRWEAQGYATTLVPYPFTQGKPCELRIEYRERAGNARFRLVWDANVSRAASDKLVNEAVDLAAEGDVAVVVVGIEEGEFRDRSSLKLPGRQEELIHRVAATGKPVVVVLVGGSAITMDAWIDEVDAVLMAWYPGEAGGLALADLLFGKRNPSGRLPITFPRNEGQLPLVYNHYPTGRGDDYVDGTGQPLFPFGYGLSYTTFTYSELKLNRNTFTTKDTVLLSITVSNTGSMAGEEVVQLYTHDELASVARPVKELKGFQRVALEPGTSKQVTFKLTASMFTLLNEAMLEVTEPGTFRLMVGGSSKDIRLRALVELME